MNNTMIQIASQLTVVELKNEIIKMMNDFNDYANNVLVALLSALESKVSENEYIAFCDSL